MASRVNTRFLLILAVALMAGGGIVGGLWFLQMRADATRNVRAGDEFMAQGEFKKAWKYYGRAVDKQPANLEYVDMLHDALLRITPQTSGEAGELYTAHLGVLAHRVRYYPLDAEAHLTLLEELHRFARSFGGQALWQRLADAADDMENRLPTTDGRREYARLYRGLAHRFLSTVLTNEEVSDAEDDLHAFLEAVPDSDLGWATLAALQSVIADRLRIEGVTEDAAEKSAVFEETLKAAPEGPEVARIALINLMRQRTQDAQAVSDDELRSAADHLADLAGRSADPFVVTEAAQLLGLGWLGGHLQAIDLLQTYLDGHPDAHRHRQKLARLQRRAGDLEAASDNANLVLGSELLAVGLLSNFQRTLKEDAASLLADIEFTTWKGAEAVDKPARLRALEAAVERLAGVVSDAEQSPALARAVGKLAFAKGEYDATAAKLEALIRARVRDLDVYQYSALALEQLGQLGRALERIDLALSEAPGHIGLIFAKARVQYKLGLYAEANETINTALAIDPQDESVQQLATAIQVGLANTGVTADTDSVARALGDAQAARRDGDLETAHSTLLAALDEQPRSLIVLSELVRVEIESGLKEEAQGHLDRALELAPTNDRLNRFQAALNHDDIVLAVKEYVETVYIDEEERAVNLVTTLYGYSRRLSEATDVAAATGQTDAAAKLEEQAKRVGEAEETALIEARRLAPDHPRLLEYEFEQAARAQDWPALERLVQKAKNLNADQAGGYLFEGRYHFIRGNFREAVRTLAEATSRKPYSSIPWRLLATAYRSLGNMGEAVRAYEQAYQCNPNDLVGVREYVETLVQTGEKLRALGIVRVARKLAPQDVSWRERWLALEVEVGDAALAINTRRAMFARNPADRLNASSLVSVLVEAEPSRELILDENGNEMYTETRWRRMSTLDRKRVFAAAREGFHREADEILNRVAAVGGEGLEIAVQRAELRRRRGQVEEGEQLLRDFIDRHEETEITTEMLIALGRYQSDTGKFKECIALLEESRARQDLQRMEVDEALGDISFSRGQYREAAAYLEQVVAVAPRRALQLQVAECYAKTRQFGEARRWIQEVVDTTGPDFTSTMLTAMIAEGEAEALQAAGEEAEADLKFAEYRASLEAAERLMPMSSVPHLQRARSLLKEFERTGELALLDDAMMVLNRADEVVADDPRIIYVRVDVLRAKGDVAGAKNELNQLLERRPADVTGVFTLVQLYSGEKKADAALEVLAGAIEHDPARALWQEMRGDIYLTGKGDPDNAVTAYAEAFRLGRSLAALIKLTNGAMDSSYPDYPQLIEHLEGQQSDFEAVPALRGQYARALNGEDRRAEALEQMRIAYRRQQELVTQGEGDVVDLRALLDVMQTLFPDRLAAMEEYLVDVCAEQPGVHELQWLAGAWAAHGDEGVWHAIELQERALRQCSEDQRKLRAQLYMDLGTLHLMVGDQDAALEVLTLAVGLDPDSPGALNNLAYLTVDHRNDRAKALPYAERADELKPNDPLILDTLGWVHFKLGNYSQAEDCLRRSIAGRPLAENHLHLAHVLAVTRPDGAEAQTYLRRAAELEPSPEVQAEIERLADDMRVSTRGGAPAGR